MFNAQFSEFSYGYALTDNILHSGLPCTPHAPVFPSLYAEGSTGGGYDVRIPLHPVPLLLQFKIPQVMRRTSAKMPAGFSTPYLRMHARTKQPNQHRLLQDLEAAGNVVCYATPDFWITPALDNHFWHQRVQFESWYIRPSDIGPLDAKSHHIAYEEGNPVGWVCSEPRRLEGRYNAEHFGSVIDRAVKEARLQEPTQFFQTLSGQIRDLTAGNFGETRQFDLERPLPEEPPSKADSKREPQEIAVSIDTRRAGREAAYLAQVRLGCTLIVTGRN